MFASGKAGGMKTVYRGILATADIRMGDLTKDDTEQTLDLSSIVPIGAKFVLLGITVISMTVGNELLIKEVGQPEYYGDWRFICHVVSQAHMARQWFALNAARELTYAASPITWITIDISVLQWKI